MVSFQQSERKLEVSDRSPFVEVGGRLRYKRECMTPEYFARSPFAIELYGDRAVVDHFVLSFADASHLKRFGDRLRERGARIAEGPGQWPDDFCPELDDFPDDLAMYFLTLSMPSGGLVVLIAPHCSGDRLDRDRTEDGDRSVPHVALRVDNIHIAARHWQEKGFIPLSPTPQNDGNLCQCFLRNWAGQIIELIARKNEGHETFSCINIRGLRLSEVR